MYITIEMIVIGVVLVCLGLLLFVLFGYIWNYYVTMELRNINETVKQELRELNVHLSNMEKILMHTNSQQKNNEEKRELNSSNEGGL